MADFTEARLSIDYNIHTNGQQEITGAILNSVLNKMVDAADDQVSHVNYDAVGVKTFAEKNYDVEFINVADYQVYDGSLTTAGNAWYFDRNTSHIIIPVTPGDRYLLKSNGPGLYGFLTSSHTEPASGTIAYVSGTTRYSATTYQDIIIPNNTAYLCLVLVDGAQVDAEWEVVLKYGDNYMDLNTILPTDIEWESAVNGLINSDGSVTPMNNDTLWVKTYSVNPAFAISVSGSSAGSSALLAELDKNGNVLAVYEYGQSGRTFVNRTFVLNKATTKVRVFGRTTEVMPNVSALSDYLYSQQQINTFLGQNKQLTDFEVVIGLVANDGKYYTNSGFYSYRIDVTKLKCNYLYVLAGESVAYVSFLTELPTSGSDVSYVGEGPRKTIAAGTSERLAVPSTAKYIYIDARDNVKPADYYLDANYTDIWGAINDIQQETKEISILFIGNSLTQDAVSYLPYLLRNLAPQVKFKFYIWYNGGYTLGQAYTKMVNNQACDMFSICANDISWANGSATMASVLANYTFDIVCLQEYFNYKVSYTEADLVDFNNVLSYIRANYAHNFKVVSLFHAPKRGNDVDSIYNLTKQGNELILKKTISESLLAPGVAIYRALSTELNNLGDQGGLSPDGTHAQEGLPCLLQAFVVFQWVMRQLSIPKSVANCQLKMTTAIYNTLNVPGPNLGTGVIEGTDAQNILAQNVAILGDKEGQGMEQGAFISMSA